MKFNFPFNNFASGEWSPKMAARTDTEQYARSCEELTNFFVQMQGGAQYRANTNRQFIPTAPFQAALDALLVGNENPAKDFKLVPYKHSNPANNTILVIATGLAFNTLTPAAGISYGANTVTTGWTPEDTQYQQVGDYLFLVNGRGTHKPKVFYYDSTSLLGYSLKDVDRDFLPYKSWRTIPWGPIEALDSNVRMVTQNNVGGNVVGATVQVGTVATPYFKTSDVGRYIRLANGTNLSAVVRITAFVSNVLVTTEIRQVLSEAVGFAYGSVSNPTSFWQISAWGDSVGWPRSIVAHQGRIIYGGNADKPDTIWGTHVGSIVDLEEVPEPNTTGVNGFANASFTANNSRAFTLTPNSANSSNIVTLSADKTLNIHTDECEIVAYGSNGALGPVNATFDSSTSFGALNTQPARVNNYSTFVQVNGYKLRDIIYNFDQDQYKSQDLSFVADHYFVTRKVFSETTPVADTTVDRIRELVKYEGRSSLLLCKTELGRLFAVTLDRDYQVNAWSRVVLGTEEEQEAPYDEAPVVLSLCSQKINGGSVVTMLVKRQVAGVDIVSVEYLSNPWELENPHNLPYNPFIPVPIYLDCATVAFGVDRDVNNKTKEWQADPTGLRPFPGAVVSVLADGNYLGEFELGDDANQSFEIPIAAEAVYIGFKYPGVVTTNSLEQGGQIGVPVGRMKRIDEVVISFFRTVGAKFGPSVESLEEIPFRTDQDLMGKATEYFTGDKVVTMPGDYNRRAKITIIQDKPYPAYIVSISARGQTND